MKKYSDSSFECMKNEVSESLNSLVVNDRALIAERALDLIFSDMKSTINYIKKIILKL